MLLQNENAYEIVERVDRKSNTMDENIETKLRVSFAIGYNFLLIIVITIFIVIYYVASVNYQ